MYIYETKTEVHDTWKTMASKAGSVHSWFHNNPDKNPLSVKSRHEKPNPIKIRFNLNVEMAYLKLTLAYMSFKAGLTLTETRVTVKPGLIQTKNGPYSYSLPLLLTVFHWSSRQGPPI